MFNNKLFKFLLNRLNGIPVYRSSEEKNKLRENFATIEHCKQILQNNGIIIVFAEGQTLHDWKLKPVKSGISKIVQHAITDENLSQKLAIVPVGLTYSDYEHPAKTIIVQSGDYLYPGSIDRHLTDGLWKQTFNALLFGKMQPLVPGMRSEEKENIRAWQIVIKSLAQRSTGSDLQNLHSIGGIIERSASVPGLTHITRQYLSKNKNDFYKSLVLLLCLAIPGCAGLLLNGVYYFPVSRWARRKTKGSIFYDALLCGLITVTYPLYLFITAALLHIITPIHFLWWAIVLPVSGWCTVHAYTLLLEVKNDLLLPDDEKKFPDLF